MSKLDDAIKQMMENRKSEEELEDKVDETDDEVVVDQENDEDDEIIDEDDDETNSDEDDDSDVNDDDEDIDDDLSDLNRKGLLKLIMNIEGLELEVNDDMKDDEIRAAIREHRQEVEPLNQLKKQREEMNKQAGDFLKKMNEKKDDGKKENKDDVPVLEDVEFKISDEDYDAALSSREKFEEVVGGHVSNVAAKLQQQVVSELPAIINNLVSQQVAMQQTITTFYDENPDLADYKQFVGFIANNLRQENPELSLEDLLMKAAETSRKKLIMAEKIEKKEKKKDKPRRQSRNRKPSKKSNQSADKLTPQEEQMLNMMKRHQA